MRKALIALLPLALMGCERVCLCHMRAGSETDASVVVECDWSRFPQQDVTGMTMLFYNESGSLGSRRSVNVSNKTSNKIADGVYDVVVFNQSDREFSGIEFAGMDSFLEAKAMGVERAKPEWAKTEQPIIYEPEWLGVGVARGIEAVGDGGSNCSCTDCECTHLHQPMSEVHVPVKPEEMTWMVYITFEVKGLENLSGIRGTLSGLNFGIRLANGEPVGKAAQMLADWVISNENILSTEMRTFGVADLCNIPIDIEMLLVDGKTIVEFSANAAESMIVDEASHTIHITLSLPEPLPDVKPTQGGFDPYVNDWGDEVEIHVP